ncbi:hypothetical protein CTRI78_v005279 [Colletotrichum trifolii]|uniref:C2H2-type domain-containing protein n=1 Tax=Colletotrichum trifolii TaxID=5466 RepID=A0A4R8REY9_COLTR|nr:hypothetical protein CTRI78_v005279 [Colletotrichum trifolii]
MEYMYPIAHGRAPNDQQQYYEQHSFSQMPPTYANSNMASNTCTPIDPNLQYQATWPGSQTHQIQQYIDGPRTSFFVPEHLQAMQNMNRLSPNAHTLPPASQRRHGSPCSQQTLSSCDSHSPPTESDVLPATPPDYSATSPFLQHKPYPTVFEVQQYQDHALFGMNMQNNACVNPLEVNLSQSTFEEEVIPADLMCPAFSFCSEPDHLSVAQHTGTFPSRQISPDPVVKQEIQVADLPYQPLRANSEDATPEPMVKAEISADEDVKDLDFSPRSSRKRPRVSPASKAASTSRSQRKRARANSNGGLIAEFNHPAASGRVNRIVCTECPTAFSDDNTYQKHMKQHHTRPFVCIFNFAGCPSTFASKNEWKRHVSSQHLALQYWLCTQEGCSKTTNPPASRRSSSSSCSVSPKPPVLPNGAIFNRKDLYTQHVRRMHVPPNVRKAQKQKKPTPEWDERLKSLQSDAEQTRCELPRHMRCPARGCPIEFNGPQAWDERMEHVARHLESAADGKEPMVCFGGQEDLTLTNWASSDQVYVVRRTNTLGYWELINPLKGEIGPSAGNGKPGSGSASTSAAYTPSSMKEIVVAGYGDDEDAEGEDEE